MKGRLLLIVMLVPLVAFAETERKNLTLTLPAADIRNLNIKCGAGSLTVTGTQQSRELRVSAEIQVEHPNGQKIESFTAQHIELNLKKQAQTAFLNAILKHPFPPNIDARINLRVIVPHGIALKISDDSGPITIRGLKGNLQINDGSGKLDIENVTGRVHLIDGSGSITITDIAGRLTIKDGSGPIEIDSVSGDVHVTDGSGGIFVSHVTGSVIVVDESGDIDITDVSKNVSVRTDTSGEVNIERIKGKITSPEPILISDDDDI